MSTKKTAIKKPVTKTPAKKSAPAKKAAPAAAGKPSATAKGKAPAAKKPSPVPLKTGAKNGAAKKGAKSSPASSASANRATYANVVSGAKTGRFSATNPNQANGPKRKSTCKNSRINGNPDSEQHVRRIDTSPNAPKQTHGFQVALYMRGEMHTKMFSDSKHGGASGALNAARVYRDACMKSPDHLTPKQMRVA
jgi:hypothetical protein